jgi:redox-sensing transcriptional repressor
MFLSQIASTQKGYKVKTLIENIEEVLGCTDSQKTALVGIGNIGRALISYFYGKGGYLSITTAFDTDETKINRVIGGCKCYHINDMEEIIKKENISIGIIAVPESDAQKTADALIISGVVGLINVTTTPIKISKNVYIENIDFTTAFEKTAYNVKMIKNKLNENNFMQNTIKNKL